MATTYNHAVAGVLIAIFSNNLPWYLKILIVIGLFPTHLPLDYFIHRHLYNADTKEKFKETWVGAVVEIFGGFFAPIIVAWYFTHISFVWLFLCVFSANLFDGLVGLLQFGILKNRLLVWLAHLNHRAHWWNPAKPNEKVKPIIQWACEIAQSIILIAILIFVIHRYGGIR